MNDKQFILMVLVGCIILVIATVIVVDEPVIVRQMGDVIGIAPLVPTPAISR